MDDDYYYDSLQRGSGSQVTKNLTSLVNLMNTIAVITVISFSTFPSF